MHVDDVFENDFAAVYVPTSRSSMIDISCSSLADLSFLRYISYLRKSYSDGLSAEFDCEQYAQLYKIYKSILAGEYSCRNGIDYVITDDRKIRLNQASDSQKAVLWLLLLLVDTIVQGHKRVLIVDEPELSLYPDTQNDIMLMLIAAANLSGSCVFIVTKSIYTLAPVNLAIQGHLAARKSKDAYNILSKEFCLCPGDVSAFKTSSSDRIEDLSVPDGLIHMEVIDEIAQDVNKKFDKLLDIELDT